MVEALFEDRTYEVSHLNDEWSVDGKPLSADIQRINPRLYHVIHNGQSYNIYVQKLDKDTKEVTLSINGKRATVKIRSRIEKLLKDLGMEGALVKKIDSIKAPMPGLVHTIKVKVGDEVKTGEPLFILEAMKMENVIKSPADVTVSKIHVNEKASVEKNQLLISFA
jgi:biotin carboxyl carrier protein